MIGFSGSVRAGVKVFEPQREPWLGAIHMSQVKDLIPVRPQNFIEHFVGNQVNRGSGRRHGAKYAWLVACGTAAAKHCANDHLPLMSILPLAYRVHPATLPDKAPHCGIFVPDVAELDLSDLPEGVVRARILCVAE